jgi:hypothetical protein
MSSREITEDYGQISNDPPQDERDLNLNNEQEDVNEEVDNKDDDAPAPKRLLLERVQGLERKIELLLNQQESFKNATQLFEGTNDGKQETNNDDLLKTLARPINDMAGGDADNSPSQPQPTNVSSSSSSSSSSSPPAAIEDKNILPTRPPEIRLGTGGTPTTDTFSRWDDEICLTVNGTARYRPLLMGVPTKAWDYYRLVNNKYDNETSMRFLQTSFLDAARTLWAFLSRGLDVTTRKEMHDHMKINIEKYNIPSLLNFIEKDSLFYQDCYSLMELLRERFQMKSAWRAAQLLDRLSKLKYFDGQDPSKYFAELSSIEQQLVSGCGYVLQNDTLRAITVIQSLPESMEVIKTTFYNDGNPTLEKVKGVLNSRWHTLNANKSRASPYSSSTRPTGAAHSLSATRNNDNNNGNTSYRNFSPQGTRGTSNYRGSNRSRGGFYRNSNRTRGNSNNRNSPNRGNGQAVSINDEDEGEMISLVSIITNIDTEHDSRENQAPSDAMTDININAPIAAASHSSRSTPQYVKNVPSRDYLLADSASTNNISGRDDLMTDKKELYTPLQISTLGGGTSATETGTLPVTSNLQLTKVKFIKGAHYSLMSIAQTCNGKYHVVFTEEGAWVYPRDDEFIEYIKRLGNHLICFDRINDLYVYNLNSSNVHTDVQEQDQGGNRASLKRARFSNSLTTNINDPEPEAAFGNVITRSQSNPSANTNRNDNRVSVVSRATRYTTATSGTRPSQQQEAAPLIPHVLRDVRLKGNNQA